MFACGRPNRVLLGVGCHRPNSFGRPDVFNFGRDVSDVRRARRHFTALLGNEIDDLRARADIELVISELVTNAIRHAGGNGTLRLSTNDRDVRIEVDDGQQEIRPRSADVNEFGGRGLALVATLTRRWGVVKHGTGKTVWAEMSAT